MKRAALFLFLACTVARAQNDNHGPVVEPTTNSADAAQAPSTDISVSATPTTPTMIAPPAAANAAPSSAVNPALSPAMNALQGIGQAPNGQKDDIYDIRPPYFYFKPMTWLWIALGVVAAIALLIAAWFVFKPLLASRQKSAYDLALEKLEKARGMLNEQDPEPYAVFVSETIRSYLGQRFRTPITRRTTEEFLRQMQSDSNTPLLAEHRDLLRHFLEACDLVKFAHYQPDRGELEQVQERAVSFVNATRPTEGVPA